MVKPSHPYNTMSESTTCIKCIQKNVSFNFARQYIKIKSIILLIKDKNTLFHSYTNTHPQAV